MCLEFVILIWRKKQNSNLGKNNQYHLIYGGIEMHLKHVEIFINLELAILSL